MNSARATTLGAAPWLAVAALISTWLLLDAVVQTTRDQIVGSWQISGVRATVATRAIFNGGVLWVALAASKLILSARGQTFADIGCGFYTSEDVQQRSIATLTLLIAAGGDINAKDNRGLTPLHEAARWGWNDVVTFLVSKGANLDAKDNRGMTPVDSAMGRAGGNSRGGARIDVHEDTAALLKKLIVERPSAPK